METLILYRKNLQPTFFPSSADAVHLLNRAMIIINSDTSVCVSTGALNGGKQYIKNHFPLILFPIGKIVPKYLNLRCLANDMHYCTDVPAECVAGETFNIDMEWQNYVVNAAGILL